MNARFGLNSKDAILLLLWCLLITLWTRLFYDVWPLAWPDEALFSSTAAAYAQSGRFVTPVLYGLIPGMQEATLWNSPLFMFLSAQLYHFWGESLLLGRLFSLILSFLVATVFLLALKQLGCSVSYRAIILAILGLDLTFLRSANTARMDMLTLLWVLSAIYLLIRESRLFWAPDNRTENEECQITHWKKVLWHPSSSISRWHWLGAGIATGLAAMSHPIAIILIPIILIQTIPRLSALPWIAAGALMALLPWLQYIARYPHLFWIQFGMQLDRKQSIFDLFGGDTGGALKVFLSQYGGGKWFMLLFAAWLGFTILALLFLQYQSLKREGITLHQPGLRLSAIWLIVLLMIILSTEGWYALYMSPLLLLALAAWLQAETKSHIHSITDQLISPQLPRWLLIASLVVFGLLNAAFASRELLARQQTDKIKTQQNWLLPRLEKCHTVYLRIRPDPYFLIRRQYPSKEVLEFIPGKLSLPVGYTELKQRYDQIDCFILNEHMSWEPLLQQYLQEKSQQFQIQKSHQPPLEALFLWQRKNSMPNEP